MRLVACVIMAALLAGCQRGEVDQDLAARAALAQARPAPVDDCQALHLAVARGDRRDPFPGLEW